MDYVEPQLTWALPSNYKAQWPLPLPPPLRQDEPPRATLILDIDETLLYVVDHYSHATNEDVLELKVRLRPHVDVFIREVSELFEVVFWTVGLPFYAASLLNLLERSAGMPETSMYSATKLLKKPEEAGEATTDATVPPTWFALSRQQTLASHDYMKYIPLVGRDPRRVLMIDDNVRSFPLTPRQGIRIKPFCGKSDDRALLDLLPMLRSVASAIAANQSDVVQELDYWRPDGYEVCDDFKDNMYWDSKARREVLGCVTSARRERPIAPLVELPQNKPIQEDLEKAVTALWRCFGAVNVQPAAQEKEVQPSAAEPKKKGKKQKKQKKQMKAKKSKKSKKNRNKSEGKATNRKRGLPAA